MTIVIGAGRVETHPDGDLLLAENIDSQQNLAEVGAEILRPVFADEVELPDDRIRRGEHRRAEGVEEAADLRRDGRARDEIVRQA